MQRKYDPELGREAEPSTETQPTLRTKDAPQHDLEALEVSPGGHETLVGECLDTRHPTLMGRVLVRSATGRGEPHDRWVATLHRLAIRPGDRVLLTQPVNWPEPVVTGVIDGFAERPRVPATPAAAVTLKPDEAVCVTTSDGAPLLELSQGEAGPVVRLLSEDVAVEMAGELRLRARSIDLKAEQGELTLEARDDVVVKGENINLN